MDTRTNPFKVVLFRLGVPYRVYFCANRQMADRFAGMFNKGLAPGETVKVLENV